jgi:hypothetical protein
VTRSLRFAYACFIMTVVFGGAGVWTVIKYQEGGIFFASLMILVLAIGIVECRKPKTET